MLPSGSASCGVTSAVVDNLRVRTRTLWLTGVVVAVVVGGLIPVLINHSYYYVDDSQSGAFGQWWEIGKRLLNWDWSLVNPTVWQSGNYLAEGAWGIFSPVLWVVGIGSHVATNAVVYMTFVKILLLVVAALGIWLLCRTFGANVQWSSVVAVAGVLTGFTLYIDAPSWVNGLMAWALWPLSWALTRRAVLGGKSPVLAAAASLGLVGIGYVHATLMLAITMIATIIEVHLARNRPGATRAWTLSVLAGLFALVVHLPSLLISPVTGRDTGIANTGLLTVNLSGLAASTVPAGSPEMVFFGVNFPDTPILYIAWLLPLGAFIAWRSFASILRSRISLVIVLLVAFGALVILPSDFGPLRFPVRLMPYLSVSALVAVAVGLSLAPAPVFSRRRFGAALIVSISTAAVALGTSPHYWKAIVAVVIVSTVAIWLAYRILAPRGLPRWLLGARLRGRGRGAATAVVAAGAIIVSVVLVYPQHVAHPRSPLRDYGVPSQISDYQRPLANAKGDVLVVGTMNDGPDHPQVWRETLVGNLFYVTNARVQNAYSSVYYPGYQNNVCMLYNGFTCGDLYTRLFKKQRDTGLDLATLMGVSTVQVIKAEVPRSVWDMPIPHGWYLVSDTANTRTIERDTVIPGAGGVAWASSGVQVTQVHEDAMGVTFKVDSAPASGGTVALSRIDWPGYSATNASIEQATTEGFLMSLHIDRSSVGKEVTVAYRSPGWQVQSAAGVLWLLLLLVWVLVRRRRMRWLPDVISSGFSGDPAGAAQPATSDVSTAPMPDSSAHPTHDRVLSDGKDADG